VAGFIPTHDDMRGIINRFVYVAQERNRALRCVPANEVIRILREREKNSDDLLTAPRKP